MRGLGAGAPGTAAAPPPPLMPPLTRLKLAPLQNAAAAAWAGGRQGAPGEDVSQQRPCHEQQLQQQLQQRWLRTEAAGIESQRERATARARLLLARPLHARAQRTHELVVHVVLAAPALHERRHAAVDARHHRKVAGLAGRRMRRGEAVASVG